MVFIGIYWMRILKFKKEIKNMQISLENIDIAKGDWASNAIMEFLNTFFNLGK